MAFLDLARQSEAFDLTNLFLQPKKYITFVPSGIWSKYSNNYSIYINGLVKITKYLAQKCDELGMALVLLPHVLRASDDRSIVDEIATIVKSDRIVTIRDVLLPYQARAILGASHFVVTQRMHGAISSLQMGVPAVSISYSVKYSDVIGAYLGLPELVVEIGKISFMEDMEKVISAIGSALEALPTLKAKVGEATCKAKRDALVQIEDVAKDILSLQE